MTEFVLSHNHKTLEKKHIRANKFTFNDCDNLPDNLDECKNLKSVIFRDSQIDVLNIPKTVKDLHIEYSHFNEINIPKSVEKFKMVNCVYKTINFSNNNSLKKLILFETREVPLFVRDCYNLIHLEIRNNELFEELILPDWISELSHLKILDVEFCIITKIPESFKRLKLDVFRINTKNVKTQIKWYQENIDNFGNLY